VFEESRDNIIGVAMTKDLLRSMLDPTLTLRDLVRPAVFIPETKRLNVLLQEFRSNRNHIAVVIDEHGGIAGLVTFEDVLEQIVGEIEDEFGGGHRCHGQESSRYQEQQSSFHGHRIRFATGRSHPPMAYHFMSATVRPAGMKGSTCSAYGVITLST
jgi:Mg2+/Co2+ transporter CorC